MLNKGSIAIDGPSASGKSSLARALANKLQWVHADTGALYRAVALSLIKASLAEATDNILCKHIKDQTISYNIRDNSTRVLLNGEDVTDILRSEEIGRTASRISQIPCVREYLFHIQRSLGEKGEVVMDGRDIGTVILPDASLKIFLLADVRTRALRRLSELEQQGIPGNLRDIQNDLEERDRRDRTRSLAPLIQAPDALLLDNSHMTIEDSVKWILQKLPN
ncbi:Cytidylate kinase [Leptospirillum ferriphilum]|jgi:cytidylate kinase|uniref:Cytidylate kinase n=2 Tax=Leptospirillum TaxID=179 RepID=A0A094W691_9BACT|nr:(d)CMP kinase [Leptospirillum ferriphilum]EDZ39284.1 MAG: Cytidylate kinase [Leptospirillum sp. Group II '5-way CG']KGA92973.1 Cytidylate kinase [Leptospirillum ferriphilum]